MTVVLVVYEALTLCMTSSHNRHTSFCCKLLTSKKDSNARIHYYNSRLCAPVYPLAHARSGRVLPNLDGFVGRICAALSTKQGGIIVLATWSGDSGSKEVWRMNHPS